MLIEESERRQGFLKEYLFEMSVSSMDETDVRRMAIKLKSLYTENFRHSYSDFFPIILEIAGEENKYNLEYLTNNLESVRSLVEFSYVSGDKEFNTLYFPLTKLSDHINLEVARYNYYSINEQKVGDLEIKNQGLQVELQNASEKLDKAVKTAGEIQTQYVTILGIFAAIILAFVGSFTFSTTLLDHIGESNIYCLVIIGAIIGLVFYNLMCILLGFLREVNRLPTNSPKSKTYWSTANFVFNCILFAIIVSATILWQVSAYKGLDSFQNERAGYQTVAPVESLAPTSDGGIIETHMP